MFHFLLFIFIISRVSASLSVPEILVLFGDQDCIGGTWVSLNNQDAKHMNTVPSIIEEKHELMSDEDKSAMSHINELAQFNEISYSYELIKEEGPPHDKTFTVTLYLGDEKYTSVGKSLKNAQKGAANLARENTEFRHPPVKIKENERTLTPTVLLNNLAAKLGLAVSYKVLTNDVLDAMPDMKNEHFVPKKSYLQQLNDTIHSNDTAHIRKDDSETKGPFTVSVEVNGYRFFGKAHTIQNAKHDAATEALKSLKHNEGAFYCLQEDDNCKSKKETIKSPISLVYEAAGKRNLGVEFEVIDAIGPAHKKVFTTKCTVGELEATGEGKSKKESKRLAAENMLPKLLKLAEVKEGRSNASFASKKSKKKSKNKIIKSTFDKIDRMLDHVMDFGKSVMDTITKKTTDDSSSSHKNDDKRSFRSPNDEVLRFGQLLSIEVNYIDLVDGSKMYSLLEMGTRPSFICLGQGTNEKNSRDLAATYGIRKLHKLGLLDDLLNKSMKTGDDLDSQDTIQKIWVDVIESEDNK